LHLQLLEDRLEHDVAAGELVDARCARDGTPAALELATDLGHRAVDRVAVEIADHERYAEALEEQRGELRGHQSGSHDAVLLEPARRNDGDARAALRAALDDVVRVERAARLR